MHRCTDQEVPLIPIPVRGLHVMPTSTFRSWRTIPRRASKEAAAGDDADCTLLQHSNEPVLHWVGVGVGVVDVVLDGAGTAVAAARIVIRKKRVRNQEMGICIFMLIEVEIARGRGYLKRGEIRRT